MYGEEKIESRVEYTITPMRNVEREGLFLQTTSLVPRPCLPGVKNGLVSAVCACV